jgi:signal transduction histidine kinase
MDILVAEDDVVQRMILKKVLVEMGHSPRMTGDGLEAWKLFEAHPTRMVISDWMMPELDGLDLCRKIRKTGRPEYVYIILLTAKEGEENAVLGLESGADDYVVKPFSPRELRARVQGGERIIRLEDEHKRAHLQLLQAEKMASIGQLSAGVAHEINNPTGFILSNLGTLEKYVDKMTDFLRAQDEVMCALGATDAVTALEEKRKALKMDYIAEDIKDLIRESMEGAERVKRIVQNLKSFSRVDQDQRKPADINECIEDTVKIVWNELKYKVDVFKNLGEIPLTQCHPQQLNQVFLNLLVNASQAIEERGEVRIRSWSENGSILVSIADTGSGIPEEVRSRIFDPFYTTKEVGKGTGLGLSLSYDIVKNHQGDILVDSEVGKGTTFTIRIPVKEG